VSRAVATIVTRSHLPHARLIAKELRRHHGDLPFHVLVIDPAPGDLGKEPFRAIALADLEGVAEPGAVEEMCFIYSAFELSCALRGLLHRYLLRKTDHESWLFIDADVFVCGDLSPLFAEIERATISLSVHATTPVFPRLRTNPEVEFLRGGVYNAGVLGLRRGGTAEAFIEWFVARLRRHATDEAPLFVDQLWLNLVPVLFPEARAIRHPGVNVGHWNLHERPLRTDAGGRILVGDEPLLLAHLSGADLDRPDRVSRHAEWLDGKSPPEWGALLARYAEGLRRHGYAESAENGESGERGESEYGFARFRDGTPILLSQRREHRLRLLAGTQEEGNPFEHPERLAPPPPPSLWRRVRGRLLGP